MLSNEPVTLRQVRADWLRVETEVAYVRVLILGQRYFEALAREQRFNPNHDALGRFTTGDGQGSGSGDGAQLANARRVIRQVTVGGRTYAVTRSQEDDLVFASDFAAQAVTRVREREPAWQPSSRSVISDPNSADGAIRYYRDLAQEANGRALVLERDGVPLGFNNRQDFEQFGRETMKGLVASGYSDALPYMRGSAVTGYSYRQGAAFDVGRRSDYDLAIASPTLIQRAREMGIEMRGGGSRTHELNPRDLK